MKKLVEKYLSLQGKTRVSELTEDEILSFFCDEYCTKETNSNEYRIMDIHSMNAINAIELGYFKKSKVIKSMAKALETGRRFGCYFILGESGDGNHFPPASDHWKLTPKVD